MEVSSIQGIARSFRMNCNISLVLTATAYCFLVQVHHAVYDNIEMEREYHSLRSTQHFGGLVWYLVQQERVVGLVGDMVDKSL